VNVREAEESIRRQQTETAFAWDSEGSLGLRKDGARDRISFEDAEIALLSGTIFTHNHPQGLEFAEEDPRFYGNSFSMQDLRLACYAELAELRVVTPRLRFSLKPPATGWNFHYWLTVMEPAYLRHKAEVSRELREASSSGAMTLAQAIATHFHSICSRVAYELGLEYRREQT